MAKKATISEKQKQELVQATVEVSVANDWNPSDLLTIMGFETYHSLDPWQKGPTTKWGTHRGLIQWGAPQAKQYGVTKTTPIKDQVYAVAEYLKDHGVKRADGILPMYAAINAGHASKINAKDAAAGGTWGTVEDKVNYQMDKDRQVADALLAQYGPNPSTMNKYSTGFNVSPGVVANPPRTIDGQPVQKTWGPGWGKPPVPTNIEDTIAIGGPRSRPNNRPAEDRFVAPPLPGRLSDEFVPGIIATGTVAANRGVAPIAAAPVSPVQRAELAPLPTIAPGAPINITPPDVGTYKVIPQATNSMGAFIGDRPTAPPGTPGNKQSMEKAGFGVLAGQVSTPAGVDALARGGSVAAPVGAKGVGSTRSATLAAGVGVTPGPSIAQASKGIGQAAGVPGGKSQMSAEQKSSLAAALEAQAKEISAKPSPMDVFRVADKMSMQSLDSMQRAADLDAPKVSGTAAGAITPQASADAALALGKVAKPPEVAVAPKAAPQVAAPIAAPKAGGFKGILGPTSGQSGTYGPSGIPAFGPGSKAISPAFAPGGIFGATSLAAAKETQTSTAGDGAGAGTHLCTLAYEYGVLTEEMWQADREYGRTVDPFVYAGYSLWAEPFAAWLRCDTFFARFMRPIVLAIVARWARFMAHGEGWTGFIIHALGAPLCRLLGAFTFKEN